MLNFIFLSIASQWLCNCIFKYPVINRILSYNYVCVNCGNAPTPLFLQQRDVLYVASCLTYHHFVLNYWVPQGCMSLARHTSVWFFMLPSNTKTKLKVFNLAIWRFLQKINGQLLVNVCVYNYDAQHSNCPAFVGHFNACQSFPLYSMF